MRKNCVEHDLVYLCSNRVLGWPIVSHQFTRRHRRWRLGHNNNMAKRIKKWPKTLITFRAYQNVIHTRLQAEHSFENHKKKETRHLFLQFFTFYSYVRPCQVFFQFLPCLSVKAFHAEKDKCELDRAPYKWMYFCHTNRLGINIRGLFHASGSFLSTMRSSSSFEHLFRAHSSILFRKYTSHIK